MGPIYLKQQQQKTPNQSKNNNTKPTTRIFLFKFDSILLCTKIQDYVIWQMSKENYPKNG